MEIEPKYTFVALAEKEYPRIKDKTTQEFLSKWGIKGNLVIQNFCFNEAFQLYHKYQLAEAFFKNEVVAKSLLIWQGNRWLKQGITASTVDVKHVPCSVLSMSFFNKLNDPTNGVVHNSGTICKRYDLEVDSFLVSDNLRGMLIDEECAEYGLYSEEERKEFIFRIFKILVLGGILCQYEEILNPYFEVTKNIYKDLIRVRRQKDFDDLETSTLVLEVIAKNANGEAYFPWNPANQQNVGFLLIDSNTREITAVLHQFGEYHPL